MIHELRTYTMRSGAAPKAAELSGSLGRDIRGDNYGRLEGYWMTEIGPLNRVMHLWSFDSLDERTRLRGELAKNERWTGEYLLKMKPMLLRQDIRLLNVLRPIAVPETTGNIYEFRNYRLIPGGAKRWFELLSAALPAREKYSKVVGIWSTEAGQPNEVCYIWAYADLNERMKARAAAMEDPDWRAFLGEASGLLERMHSTIMLPAGHSKLQ